MGEFKKNTVGFTAHVRATHVWCKFVKHLAFSIYFCFFAFGEGISQPLHTCIGNLM